MQQYKILVAYDGTDFYGWQIQPHCITITQCLERTFYKTFGRKISLLGASRTDTGVHALGQVARFHTDLDIDVFKLWRAWNKALPSSIVIRSLNKVDNSFHPCCNVRQKTYYYHLFTRQPMPFVARYGWHYRYIKQVDLGKLEKCLKLYLGTHDFRSFCKVDDAKEAVRTIDTIKIQPYLRWGVLQIVIKGKSFLRFQIRRMVGYALDVARRDDLSVSYLQGVLTSSNPRQTLLKASAKGLCLKRVVYYDD